MTTLPQEKEKKLPTKQLVTAQSDWVKHLLPGPKGFPVLMPIGDALNILNKKAYFDAYAFLDDELDKTCYVISEKFLATNGIVWPVYGFDSIYPITNKRLKDPTNYVNWRTRHFRKQLQLMK